MHGEVRVVKIISLRGLGDGVKEKENAQQRPKDSFHTCKYTLNRHNPTSLPQAIPTHSENKTILVAIFCSSRLLPLRNNNRVWVIAARTMITAKHPAATGVSTGAIPIHQGKISPAAPRTSLIPIKRIKPMCRPVTPVCPLAISDC